MLERVTGVWPELSRFLKVFLMEKVHDKTSRKGWTNAEVLKYWRIAPKRVEIAVRRTSWLQAMSREPKELSQLTTAVWGTILNDSPASAT